MKKLIIFLTVAGMVGGLPLVSQASPEGDLKQWRSYFINKFGKDVRFDEYSNGLYALPNAKDRREEWESIMEFPPYELQVEAGRNFWRKNNLGSCFRNGGRKIAQNYPYWNGREVRTVELDINDCLRKKGKKPIKNLEKGTMAEVVAYMKNMSRGQRVKIDLSSPGARAAYEKGKEYFWARRGQLNFSCAHCHVDNAGKLIGGNILSPGLGHGVGFPAYRSKWGELGTLHRRYRGCNKQVRAKPLPAQSKTYRNLELYEAYMNTNLPLTAPSQRF